MTIKHGIGTKISAAFAILLLLPPLVMQIIALVENVAVKWASGEKISLIAGAATAAILALTKAAQAVAAILKGHTNV